MFKLSKFLPFLLIFTVAWMSLFPVQGNARTISTDQKEQTQEFANELEYLFSVVLTKNEKTGMYTINNKELINSPYTEKEREDLVNAVNSYNQQLKGISTFGTFDRCMQDLLGISSAVWKEIKGYIDAEQYLAAASAILFATGVAVNPVVIGIFVLTCGPSKAG